MKKREPFRVWKLMVLILCLLLIMFWAVAVGSADLSVSDSMKILFSHIPGFQNMVSIEGLKSSSLLIVWDVRLPRILMSMLVGGSLAVVGASFQGVFQNSLADPHILGVSSGAALGATIAMLTGLVINFWGLGAIGLMAFIGAMATVFVVYKVARIGGEISTTNMLLTGTAISTLLGACISLLMTFHNEQIAKVYMWTMGSFTAATWEKVGFLAVFSVIGVGTMIAYSGKLNILMMGEEDAKCLGVDTEKIRRVLIIVASLLVAAAVSVSGIIGFVGLIIPHCVRMIGGSDNRKLMPYSFFIGAIFLVLCDTVARTIATPSEIPVGIITSIFGAPYFIVLILNKRRRF